MNAVRKTDRIRHLAEGAAMAAFWLVVYAGAVWFVVEVMP